MSAAGGQQRILDGAPMDFLDQAIRMWRESESVVALTGAGISVPSGVPDFRSPGGLWSRFDPDEVASLGAFRRRPDKVWAFLLEAGEIMSRARPNPAHLALAELEREGLVSGVITQNIDGLHQRAGSANVVDFHGSMGRLYCTGCDKAPFPDGFAGLKVEDEFWRCECGGAIRPDIVFFGEGIPDAARRKAQELCARADLAVIVGTSGDVAPANLIPSQVKSRGGKILEINLGQTAFGRLSDLRLDIGVEIALPRIAAGLLGHGNEI